MGREISGKTRSIRSKVPAVVMAAVLACAVAVPLKALADIRTNYDWYRGHESGTAFSISTAGEMKALANIVNGTADYDGDGAADAPADTFEGKVITLTTGLPVDFLGENIEPIGTAEHPFCGTFDGTRRQIDNFKLSIPASSSHGVRDIGLFGHVGAGGRLVGVSVGRIASISIERSAASADYIANVGLVAGFCAGSMTNCRNAGALSVESEVVQRSEDDYLPVRNIGGVAGQCVFDMENCSNAGAVTVREASSPVAEFDRPQLAARIGGVVGLLGDEANIGDYKNHIFGDPAKHGAMRGCTNTAMISVDTPKLSGSDRFGQQTNAESMFVGGVVGYSQGSVTGCVNGQAQSGEMGSIGRDVGYVRAENGNMVGGICGSLRGVQADNNKRIAYGDDGADGNDPLDMVCCTNYGDVYGRVATGGIVGKASSYTTVTACLNQNKRDAFGNVVDTFVVATRWNKPCPAGIAGMANGEVSYCANFATVASAIWADEDARTLVTQDGYYAAGIVGMLAYFGDSAERHAGEDGGVRTPISETFSCYNAGSIVAGANMRQRGVVGQNDGYVYDNILVAGLVYNDEVVYGDDVAETEASGAVGENKVYKAAELLSGSADTTGEAIALLNRNSEANGWQRYWIMPRDTSAGSLNEGYPLLALQDPWGDAAISIAGAETSLAEDARYTGGVSVPSVAAKLSSAQLVENADFRVVPEPGATKVSSGKPYTATVMGLGRYRGTAAQTVPYDIVAGDFATCSLTVAAHTFDYGHYEVKAEDVTVRTPAGTAVPSSEYTYRLVDENGDTMASAGGDAAAWPVDADTYQVEAVAKPESELFTGTVKGTYRVKPASFMQEVKLDDVKISYLGEDYPWADSKKTGEYDNPSTTLPYTGVPVKPAVGAITYKGKTLVEGTDYRVVYGNSNSDDGYPDDQDEYNLGKEGGKTIGCVTIRNITGRKSNFTSYANMFFWIDGTGAADSGGAGLSAAKTDLAHATYGVDGAQISDGAPIEPVELYLGRAKLTEGVDYTIEYANNVFPGTATFTATGTGLFEGTLSGSFAIEEGSAYELSYAFSGTGTDADPYEATVTGVEYLSSRATFQLIVPAQVEHGGRTYAVTAIGDSAFGGRGIADFRGSAANESKLKIASASIPASVCSIGEYAFGTSSITMPDLPPLASVDIASGSQLASIGAHAFEQCTSLATFTFPAGVSHIGDSAFSDCKALAELRFLTREAGAPTAVSASAFKNCTNVVVRGFEDAVAVKDIAEGNGKAVRGANGGRAFTFEPLQSLAGAQVSAIADQVYTGDAIKPEPAVTLDGARLVRDEDYELAYEDNVNAGQARVVVRGIGSWAAEASGTFAIVPVEIGSASIARLEDRQFSGSPVDIAVNPAFNGKSLVEGVDYTVSFADETGRSIAAPTDVGSYQLVLNGQGNFKGMTYRTFRIVAASAAEAVFWHIGAQAYTGARIEPDVRAKLGEADLVCGRDFVVAYTDNVEVGQATAHVYGIGGFTGEAELPFRINAASLSEAVVAGVYDVRVDPEGAPVSFDPVVIVDGVQLKAGRDFDVAYYVAEEGSAEGGKDADAQADAGADADAGSSAETPPSSSPALQGASDTDGAGAVNGAGDVRDAEKALEHPPTAIGTYELVVVGKGSYTGTAKAKFAIQSDPPATLTNLSRADGLTVALAEGSPASFAFDGMFHKPEVRVSLAGEPLKRGADFVVAYEDNVNPGEAQAVVYGIGAYVGRAIATARFSVASVEITPASIEPVPDAVYTGSAICPHPIVRMGGRALTESVDFTVEYGENLLPGAAAGTFTVAGAGGYTGRATATFDIAAIDIAGALVTLAFDQATYTGADICPAVSVSLDGRTLEEGVDYAVEYSDNRSVGQARATVNGIRGYSGSVNAMFDIVDAPQQSGFGGAPSDDAGALSGASAATAAAAQKAENKIAAKVAKSYKKAKLAKKARTFALPKPRYGKAAYQLATKDKRRVLSLQAKKGLVKVKKGARTGTYTMKVRATVKAGATYPKLSKAIVVRVTVR